MARRKSGLGFLDAMFDKKSLIKTAKVGAGGMLGGAAFSVALAKIAWLSEGDSENVKLAKFYGAGTALAIAGAFAAERMGQGELGKGFVGGATGMLGTALLAKLAPDALTPAAAAPVSGYGRLGQSDSSSFVQFNGLDATRSYQSELPANVGGLGRVSVSSPDPAELAAMTAFAA